MKPDKPFSFDMKRLTMGEQKALLRVIEDPAITSEQLEMLQRLLAAGSEWTYEDLEDCTGYELEELFAEIQQSQQEVEEEAVNPQSGNFSSAGQPGPETVSLPGSEISE